MNKGIKDAKKYNKGGVATGTSYLQDAAENQEASFNKMIDRISRSTQRSTEELQEDYSKIAKKKYGKGSVKKEKLKSKKGKK